MSGLELKIPPPIVALATAGLIALASWGLPSWSVDFPGRRAAAAVLAGAGAAININSVLSFRRAKTTINPMAPGSASRLMRSGLYAVTRNPMYLGLFGLLLGWGIFLANPAALLPLAAFILYMNRFQILPEERALAERFGEEFLAYRSQVRRWL